MMNQPPPGSAGAREVSPRKKKGQISFAQPSFLSSLDLDDITNKKVCTASMTGQGDPHNSVFLIIYAMYIGGRRYAASACAATKGKGIV
jgi:hypothetical protein